MKCGTVCNSQVSVDAYVTNILKFARAVGVEGDQLRYTIQRGLRPALLAHVIQSQPSTVDELIQAAHVAEAACLAAAAASTADPSFDRVVAELAANRQAAGLVSEINLVSWLKINLIKVVPTVLCFCVYRAAIQNNPNEYYCEGSHAMRCIYLTCTEY